MVVSMSDKCEDCKYSNYFSAVFLGSDESSDIHSTTCKLKNKEVNPENKCGRFIKRNGKSFF